MEATPDLDPNLFEPARGRRARRHRATGEIWQRDMLHADHWEKDADLARRLEDLTVGLTVARVLKADDRELVVEFEDGTRLLVRAKETLDVSVT